MITSAKWLRRNSKFNGQKFKEIHGNVGSPTKVWANSSYTKTTFKVGGGQKCEQFFSHAAYNVYPQNLMLTGLEAKV